MHDQKLAKNESFSAAEKPPVSKVYVGNGLFYAVMPDEKELEKAPFFQKQDSDAANAADFGYIAETMGVNIEADEVVLRIKVGDKEETHSLKRVEGCPFKIDIWNVDPDISADTSDLPVCYQFLSDQNGAEFELKPKVEDALSGNPVMGREFCHLIFVEQDSIDNFV